MKKLFLSVVLLLTVSFAFAVNDVETVSVFDDATVELINSVDLANVDFTIENDETISLEAENCGFQVTFIDDYGSTSYWEDCSFSGGMGSFDDWISHIIDWINS